MSARTPEPARLLAVLDQARATAREQLRAAWEIHVGRADRNLYGRLREAIDAERKSFRRRFMEQCASLVDYLHQELVRTLANGDEALLGPDYPGPIH